MEKWLGPASKKLATTERLSDCRFIIKAADGSKQIFDCHKWTFSCASNVFEQMFFEDFLESKSSEIVLENVQPELFAKIREYLYNDDTKLFKGCDENTLIDLIKFGQQYSVTSVTEECIKILAQRTSILDIEILIQIYQFGNNILREDLIQAVWENITSRFPASIIHDAIYNLSSDAFFKYMEMSKETLREAMRFDMIETYLIVNSFKVPKDISKPSDDINQVDFETTEANEEDKDLEQHDQIDDNDKELEDDNKSQTRNNVPNEDNKVTIQSVQFKTVKNAYIKNLLGLIDYKKMTPQEFYNGPGKSQFFDLQEKYDMLYATMPPK